MINEYPAIDRPDLETPFEPVPESDLDLLLDRDRHVFLLRVARRKYGLTVDDAEDLAMEAWLKIRQNDRWLEPDAFKAYASRTLNNLWIDNSASPVRILQKRLNNIVAVPKGPDPIEVWLEGPTPILGLRSLRSVTALSRLEVKELPINEFLYARQGLGGANPLNVATRQVLDRFFQWLGKPVDRVGLSILLAPILVEKISFVRMGDIDEPVSPARLEISLDRYRDEIVKLPPKMRAAILLKMDDEMLESVLTEAREKLPDLIQNWRPPPPLATLPLPAADSLVAERLGIEKNHLQVLRARAREILWAAFAKWGTE